MVLKMVRRIPGASAIITPCAKIIVHGVIMAGTIKGYVA